jgi:hypothetical protein
VNRERLCSTILRYAPNIVAFTSNRAGSEFLGRLIEYGLQSERVGSNERLSLPTRIDRRLLPR